MINRMFIFSFYLFLFFNAFAIADTMDTIRAVWIVRHSITTPEKIDEILTNAHKNGFTDLLVQVRGRGDAYYRSKIEPIAYDVKPDFNPLAYFLAHKNRKELRIHAWINTFYVWSKPELPSDSQHVVVKHPEWLSHKVDFDPENFDENFDERRNTEGLYLSPALPEVQRYTMDIVNDLLSSYKVDGIHLDYVRYPGGGFEFDQKITEKFQQLYGLDPRPIRATPDEFSKQYGEAGYEIFYSRWGEYLRNELSNFIENFSVHVKSNFPNVVISAAVKADLRRAHWYYYQAWDIWLKNGWIDWAAPMNYAKDNASFQSRIKLMQKRVDFKKIVMGIALYNQPAYSSNQKMKYVLDRNIHKQTFAGIALFSYSQFIKDRQTIRLFQKLRSN